MTPALHRYVYHDPKHPGYISAFTIHVKKVHVLWLVGLAYVLIERTTNDQVCGRSCNTVL